MTPQQPDDLADAIALRFAAARLWAVHHAPYLASALFALRPVVVEPNVDDTTGAMIPDDRFAAFPADVRWAVHLEPATVLATDVPEIGWWLLHHVGHLVRGHALRSPFRGSSAAGTTSIRTIDAIIWNQAADAEINDDLDLDDIRPPAGVVVPRSLGLPDNLVAEQYVSMLEVLSAAVAADDPSLGRGIDCGSCSDGVPRDWDDDGEDAAATDVDRELLSRAIQAEIAKRMARRSDVPAGWRRWAGALGSSATDWRTQFRSAVSRAAAVKVGNADFSYRRPARRSAAFDDILMPAMVRPVPVTAMIVDTSSSLGPSALGAVLTEVAAVAAQACRSHRFLPVICCDTEAHGVQKVRDVSQLDLTGGGGTDLRAGFAAADALRPKPDIVIVVTDGDTPWPAGRPKFGAIVVCLVDGDRRVPSWASKIVAGDVSRPALT
jgi:predicted metal-dependent peptidase